MGVDVPRTLRTGRGVPGATSRGVPRVGAGLGRARLLARGLRFIPLKGRLPCRSSCRNTAEPRSPTWDASASSPSGSSLPAATGSDVVVVVSAMGAGDRRAARDGEGDRADPRTARAGHAAHGGRAHRDVLARDRDQRARVQGGVLHGLAGGHHHRHRSRPREDHRRASGADPRVTRRGQRRHRRRVPGRLDVYDVTTLGRGGSDTTAVALAAALGAEFCEIYTDVEGVFTADPRIVPQARTIPAISYDEMLELAAGGAKVLQLRAVEYARRHHVRVHVRSSFTDEPGTWVTEEDERMEQAIISGCRTRRHRGEGHDRAGARPPRRGRVDLPRGRRRGRQRRHDRAERLARRRDRHLLHRAPKADLPRLERVVATIVEKVGAIRRPTTASRRSRWSARG